MRLPVYIQGGRKKRVRFKFFLWVPKKKGSFFNAISVPIVNFVFQWKNGQSKPKNSPFSSPDCYFEMFFAAPVEYTVQSYSCICIGSAIVMGIGFGIGIGIGFDSGIVIGIGVSSGSGTDSCIGSSIGICIVVSSSIVIGIVIGIVIDIGIVIVIGVGVGVGLAQIYERTKPVEHDSDLKLK